MYKGSYLDNQKTNISEANIIFKKNNKQVPWLSSQIVFFLTTGKSIQVIRFVISYQL